MWSNIQFDIGITKDDYREENNMTENIKISLKVIIRRAESKL
jgi:hypothetical protein